MTSTSERSKHDGKHLRKLAAEFRGADAKRSNIQLIVTLSLFFACWFGMFVFLKTVVLGGSMFSFGFAGESFANFNWLYFLALLGMAIPTGSFIVRLFMIQHDCGHGSFYKSAKIADRVGFLIGCITLTPYEYWRKTHAYHHAHSGDLDFRGFGDIRTLTREEYLALGAKDKLAYRIYRNPLVLLGLGAAFHFIFKHRYPWDIPKEWKKEWRSVWYTNIVVVTVAVAMSFLVGWREFILIQLPVTMVACSIGVWLFYVQHQFDEAYWAKHDNWDYFDAALAGSSHLVLPRPLQWLSASIGIHHIHHMSSLVPNYKLQDCLDKHEEFQKAVSFGIKDTFRLFKLTIWDEEAQRLISFRDLKRSLKNANPA